MISDHIEDKLKKLIEKTKKNSLYWKPISDYIDFLDYNEALTERVVMLRVNEFIDFYEEKSFFVKINDSILALLTYRATSAYDGTVTDECELIGAICGNSKIIKIPPYIDGGMETLLNSILKYQQFKSDSNYVEPIELLDIFLQEN